MLADAGTEWENLDWREIDLEDGPEWSPGSGVEPGALLRVGERVVVLFENRGDPRLDYEDLCFDYDEGAEVEPLRRVFSGQGLVELAALTSG